MSDTTQTPQAADRARDEALNWLAGQFRWEALLADLHELAHRQEGRVVELDRRDDTRRDSEESAA